MSVRAYSLRPVPLLALSAAVGLTVCLAVEQTLSALTGAVVDPAGLIGSWHLDGNADDGSGSGHHGTIVGSGVTVIPDGVAGPALRFDGNGSIDVGNLDFSGGAYTVSMWVRTVDPPVDDLFRMALGKGLTAGDMTFELMLSDDISNDAGYLVWDAWHSSAQINPQRPDVNLRDGTWHMVAATYATGIQRLYVDGVLVGSAAYAGVLPLVPDPVMIGGFEGFGPYHHRWVGDIDEVEIYTRALTEGEVQASYRRFAAPVDDVAILQDPVHNTLVRLADGAKVAVFTPRVGSVQQANATNTIAVAPDGTRAVVASASGQFDVYDLTAAPPRRIATYDEAPSPQDVEVTPDGRFAVLQDPAHITIVRLADGAKAAVFTPRVGNVQQANATNTIAVSPDSMRAVVASASGQFDVYDLTAAPPRRLATYDEAPNPQDVEVTPDGRFAVLQDPAHTTIVRLADGTKAAVFTPRIWGLPQLNATNTIAVSPDSTRAVVASASGQFDVYNLTTTAPTVIVSYNETQNPQDVEVTPDGRFAVLQDSAHTTIVRLTDGAKAAVFTPRSWGFPQLNATNTIAVSPDGTRAAVASASGQFDVYNLTTSPVTRIATYDEAQNPQDVDVTPDGKFAVLQDPAHITIVRLADGAKVATFTPRMWGFNQAGASNTIAVSPDSSRAVVASASGQFDVYDLTTSPVTRIATYDEAQNPQDVAIAGIQRLASTNLTVTGTDTPDPASAGEPVTYSFVLTNAGPLPATDVRLVDNLPEGISFVSAEATQGSCSVRLALVCDVGDVPVAATVQVTIVVTAGAAGTVTNSVTAAANERDTFLDDNTATLVTEIRANRAPISTNDAVVTIEDVSVAVSVLTNDIDPDGDPLSIAAFTQPAHGLVTAVGGGLLTYLPNPNFNGVDLFTYTASDGHAIGGPATVSVTVAPVNDAPGFTKGPDQRPLAPGPQVVSSWATGITPGPQNENSQGLNFVVTTDAPALFNVTPAISAGGTLSYTPASDRAGTATVTVLLHDDGGTLYGGIDTTPPSTFTITTLMSAPPDPACNGTGVVVLPFDGYAQWYDVVVQPDGKLLAAGSTLPAGGTSHFALARFNSNCTLDPTFGGASGMVGIDFSSYGDYSHALVRQPDGKVVVGGDVYTAPGQYAFAIARLNVNGTLDGGFGIGGKVVIPFTGSDSLSDLALLPDGRIVVVGSDGHRIQVAMLTSNGALDPAFDGDGKKAFQVLGTESAATSVAIDSDGRIAIAGAAGGMFGVARLLANGDFDPSFGSSGMLRGPDFVGSSAIQDLIIQPDNKIVVGGYQGVVGSNPYLSQLDFALARYNEDGSLDAGFGSNGKVVTDLASPVDIVYAMARQADGKIVVAGATGFVGDSPATYVTDFAVLRYAVDGTLEGLSTTDLLGRADFAFGVAIQPDGKIVAVGQAYDGSGQSQVALARYLGGSPGMLPDLAETAVNATPSTASPGGKLTVTDTVTNIGSAAAAASTTRYFLSVDPVKSVDDVLFSAKRAVVPLPAQQSSTGTKTVTIPGAVVLGSYYVLACADDLQKVREQDESANCLASSSRVLIDWPDLIITSLANPPSNVAVNGRFTVTETVTNRGLAVAGASSTRYYLSLNGIKDATDVLLTGARAIASLAPGASSPGSRQVRVPAGTLPGSYFVLACADDLQKVGESTNEGNNCGTSATAITVHP